MGTVAPLPPPGTVEGRGIAKGVPLGEAVERRRPGASFGPKEKSDVDKKKADVHSVNIRLDLPASKIVPKSAYDSQPF